MYQRCKPGFQNYDSLLWYGLKLFLINLDRYTIWIVEWKKKYFYLMLYHIVGRYLLVIEVC